MTVRTEKEEEGGGGREGRKRREEEKKKGLEWNMEQGTGNKEYKIKKQWAEEARVYLRILSS